MEPERAGGETCLQSFLFLISPSLNFPCIKLKWVVNSFSHSGKTLFWGFFGMVSPSGDFGDKEYHGMEWTRLIPLCWLKVWINPKPNATAEEKIKLSSGLLAVCKKWYDLLTPKNDEFTEFFQTLSDALLVLKWIWLNYIVLTRLFFFFPLRSVESWGLQHQGDFYGVDTYI